MLISPRGATEQIRPHFLLFLGADTRIAGASRRRCDPRRGYDDGIVPAVVPAAREARSAFAHRREEAHIAADPVPSTLSQSPALRAREKLRECVVEHGINWGFPSPAPPAETLALALLLIPR